MLVTQAELARGISPRAPHRTGLKPLDLSGSCHRSKAAAFHLSIEFLPLPVDPSKWRWPAPFAPRALPRFTTTTKQSAPSLAGASVLSASRLTPLAPFPL